MVPHGKELSEDLKRRIVVLHEDGQGYKKIPNTLKLSCSPVAKIIQHFKRAGSTQNRPRVGRPKNLSARAERHIQMLSLKDRRRSPVSIAAEIEEVGGQPDSAQTIHRALHQLGVPQEEDSSEDDTQESLQTCQQSTWITETMSYVLMKINLFGSDGFKHVWWRPGEEYKDKCVMPTVKHGGENVMV